MDSTLAPGEPVGDGVRRIALGHTDRAIAALGPDFADDPDDAVHEVRKRCKKIRAMARLVRPVVRRSAYREVGPEAVRGFRMVLEAMMDPDMRRHFNRLKEPEE